MRFARAHPRSRGENLSSVFNPVSLIGSSPLTRGKRHLVGIVKIVGRLIPAHAGKTHRSGATSAAPRAHPRSRGENTQAFDAAPEAEGSSPLTRGKRDLVGIVKVVRRLIPAHAGKTKLWTPTLTRPRAHPRSRGENNYTSFRRRSSTGSSPLTRGKLLNGRKNEAEKRLIPAHAGKTSSHADAAAQDAAHPRSRGENVTQRRNATASGGSSPLTRGKLCRVSTNHRKERLIPAHAGKTRAAQPTRRRARAHPRSRGENRTGT